MRPKLTPEEASKLAQLPPSDQRRNILQLARRNQLYPWGSSEGDEPPPEVLDAIRKKLPWLRDYFAKASPEKRRFMLQRSLDGVFGARPSGADEKLMESLRDLPPDQRRELERSGPETLLRTGPRRSEGKGRPKNGPQPTPVDDAGAASPK